MKKYGNVKNIIMPLVALGVILTSCKKDNLPARPSELPRTIVQLNQKPLEVSVTNAAGASVVLISGFGSEIDTWQKLYKQLPANYSVFTYNRPGVGKSANVAGERSGETIAREMNAILAANNIRPPYVLVGHSLGGIYARLFANLFPAKTRALVLIDATPEKQIDTLLSFVPAADRAAVEAELQSANEAELNALPNGSVKEEFRASMNVTFQQMKAYPAITNKPVYVIANTKIESADDEFTRQIAATLQHQWATAAGLLGKFISTGKSGHFIHEQEPELVVEGIKWVLNK